MGKGLPGMSRLVVVIVVVVVLVGGGIYAFASRNAERPQARVEKVVPLATLQK